MFLCNQMRSLQLQSKLKWNPYTLKSTSQKPDTQANCRHKTNQPNTTGTRNPQTKQPIKGTQTKHPEQSAWQGCILACAIGGDQLEAVGNDSGLQGFSIGLAMFTQKSSFGLFWGSSGWFSRYFSISLTKSHPNPPSPAPLRSQMVPGPGRPTKRRHGALALRGEDPGGRPTTWPRGDGHRWLKRVVFSGFFHWKKGVIARFFCVFRIEVS